jgi:hypothetical protein
MNFLPRGYVLINFIKFDFTITHINKQVKRLYTERGGTRSIITYTEINTCNAMLGVYVVYTVILLI